MEHVGQRIVDEFADLERGEHVGPDRVEPWQVLGPEVEA